MPSLRHTCTAPHWPQCTINIRNKTFFQCEIWPHKNYKTAQCLWTALSLPSLFLGMQHYLSSSVSLLLTFSLASPYSSCLTHFLLPSSPHSTSTTSSFITFSATFLYPLCWIWPWSNKYLNPPFSVLIFKWLAFEDFVILLLKTHNCNCKTFKNCPTCDSHMNSPTEWCQSHICIWKEQ